MLHMNNLHPLFELIRDETSLLQSMDHEHNLLYYASHSEDPAVWNEFLERFGGTEGSHPDIVAKAYYNYSEALREAIENPKKKLIVCDDTDSY